MSKLSLRLIVTGSLAGMAWQATAQTNLWEALDSVPAPGAAATAWVQPQSFKPFRLRRAALESLLSRAPKESAVRSESSPALITLPMPDGTLARFRFVESPIMAPELAAKFPGIRTYRGRSLDDPLARVRFDLTPAGFHAQILSPRGAVYIDPYLRGDTTLHAVYFKRDYRREADDFQCHTAATSSLVSPAPRGAALISSNNNLRTYRLACATTAEYTQFFGGTVADGLAAVVSAINRVDGVYESELAISLVLVANEDLIICTNTTTEPYDNNNALSLLSQNQSNLDAIIGDANYDIGHVFGTAAGGLSLVGVVGVSGFKAQSETGVYPPTGDAFYIDYAAHEMGHEFGAFHPFNSSDDACGGGNRYAAAAFEPGSGSTIMAYAGICGTDNLQTHSDPYFHSASLEEINAYITSGIGNGCAVLTASTNSTPSVDAGPPYTIPMSTPFTLTATGSDADGDALTYCWEERDLGPSVPLTAPDNGTSPLFRSFLPTNCPSRTFPQSSDLLNNTQTPGEQLPTTSRTMNFRVTVRDNSGCSGSSDTQVTVVTNAGPFVVTSPAGAVMWSNTATIQWLVAGTAAAPINATNVNILLSIDGGNTFPIVLATNVPNSGSQDVLLPNLFTTTARIEIQAANNIFFALSPANFTIEPSSAILGVSQSASVPVVPVASNLTYTITLTNLGAYPLKNVKVTDVLGLNVTIVSVGTSDGTWSFNNGTLTWLLHSLEAEDCTELLVTVMADYPGPITNCVSATDDSGTNVLVVNASDGQPILAPIPNQIVHAGATVWITNSASEAGLPAADLVFALGPAAPAGAGIDPLSGVLSWTTSAADANTTNLLTVQVTDTTSELSATQSFFVTVLPAPLMTPWLSSRGTMMVSWSAIPGQAYIVQYKNALTDPQWANLAPAVTAIGTSVSFEDPISPTGQRFYRVIAAP